MRTGARKESVESRGGTSWNDGLYPVDGEGLSNGSISETQDSGIGTGGTGRGGADAVGKTSWFDPIKVDSVPENQPVMECKDGVCPVPWAVKEEAPAVLPDVVNHPPHYTEGEIECIEAIEAGLTLEEFRGYCKGNVMKYNWRERHKGGTESLKKALWYLERLIQLDEAQKG